MLGVLTSLQCCGALSMAGAGGCMVLLPWAIHKLPVLNTRSNPVDSPKGEGAAVENPWENTDTDTDTDVLLYHYVYYVL